LVIAFALAAAGCSLIPGSAANLEKVARNTLSRHLFDSDTAKFQGLRYGQKGERGEQPICGQVNAKNQLGAYAGFRRFIASPSDGFAAIDPQVDSTVEDLSKEGIDRTANQAGFDALWKLCDPAANAGSKPA
jgi:hypothetical protein